MRYVAEADNIKIISIVIKICLPVMALTQMLQ